MSIEPACLVRFRPKGRITEEREVIKPAIAALALKTGINARDHRVPHAGAQDNHIVRTKSRREAPEITLRDVEGFALGFGVVDAGLDRRPPNRRHHQASPRNP
jgi:hypothetical protein